VAGVLSAAPEQVVLAGSCTKQRNCLAAYTLEHDRTSDGRPVYRHATADQILAYLDGSWCIQGNEDVGTNVCWMMVNDSALHPVDITGVWWEYDGSSWLDAPTVKALDVAGVLSAAPEQVVLTGSCTEKRHCLAAYTLEEGRTSDGRPVYRHATADQMLAYLDGSWRIQANKDVGTNVGWMMAEDSALHPVDITGVWWEYTRANSSWVDAPAVKVLDVADVLRDDLAKAADETGAGAKKRKRAAGGGASAEDAKRRKTATALTVTVASMDGSALALEDAPEAATVRYVKQQVVEQRQLRPGSVDVHIFAKGVEDRLADDVALGSVDFSGQEKPTLFVLVTELSVEELTAQRTVLVQKHEALQALMRQRHAGEKKVLDDLIREMGVGAA
jgi:hypothetical protein